MDQRFLQVHAEEPENQSREATLIVLRIIETANGNHHLERSYRLHREVAA